MRHPIYARTKTAPMHFKLSILIPTLSSRWEVLKELIDELNYQIQSKPVQILWIGDNRSMTIGEKRNELLQMAKGDWIAFIDDDDKISINYIKVLLNAIEDNPNKTVITFRGTQNTDGKLDLPFRYNVNYGRNYKSFIDGARWKLMLPDHLCCWNKSKITIPFPNKSLGEDHEWARKMAFTYTEEDQVLLEHFLYHYEFNRISTETRR